MPAPGQDRLLSRARKLLAAKRFDELIRLLEPEVVRYHDSFTYYHLLALACLHSGDYGGAHTYYRRAREIKIRSVDVLLGMAVLFLRRGDTNKAIESWLEVLSYDAQNKLARRALDTVRGLIEKDRLEDWLEAGKSSNLFPPVPSRGITRSLIIGVSLALLLIFSVFFLPGLLEKQLPGDHRDGYIESALDADERIFMTDNTGTFKRILSSREVDQYFERARKLFRAYRDERARVALNHILQSNASDAVKAKAEDLKEYLVVPGFDSLEDRIPFEEVHQDPSLYVGCHVIWRGMAANISGSDGTTRFDLLVGYDSKSTLRGIVPVKLSFASAIESDRPLEVLGRIEIAPESGRLKLEGLAIHQSRALNPRN